MDYIDTKKGLSKTDFRSDMYNIAVGIFETLDLSESTRKDYLYRAGLFVEYVTDTGLSDCSYRDYKRYLGERTDYTVATKNKYLVSAKIFCKELYRLGFFDTDITVNVKSFKESKKHKLAGLSAEEVKKVFDYVDSMQSIEGVRSKAIIALLALQGFRQIEIRRLDVKDIDFVASVAMARGKGADDKEAVFLNPYTLEAIRDYMQAWNVKSGALFVSTSNNSRSGRLSTRSIRAIVTDLFEAVGVKKNVHGFRHFFTTELIKTYKGDLSLVSSYTRHKSLETLQIYNDAVITKNDLPRFFGVFDSITGNSIEGRQLQGV